jgi:hypothetical protein
LSRFFAAVALCIAVLLATGGHMLSGVDWHVAPKGWHAMVGLGLLMCLVFGHLYFVPFRRLLRASALGQRARSGPAKGQQVGAAHPAPRVRVCARCRR